MKENRTILVVDDEPAIREMVQLSLELAGFRCLQAANAREAHALILDERPDLVLLDWMMPETNGYELLRRLRKDEATARIPVIMVTAKTEEASRVHGLEGGADDYIGKPYSPRELVARIRALLRRAQEEAVELPLEYDGLRLDPVSHRVFADNRALEMGPTEFRLLHFLMSHPERAYTRAQLLDNVWGTNVYIDERTVDVHMRRLRKALGPARKGDSDFAPFVQTVRGTGYRFSTHVMAES
jgi:two-component system, OmpR family, phosphate regulon response regulator PhoB